MGFICVLQAYFLSIFALLLHNIFHMFGSIHSRFQSIHSILEILVELPNRCVVVIFDWLVLIYYLF